MQFPLQDWSRWSIKRGYGFGDKTSYGFHGGTDINLKTGGDSDLGQPILAISEGTVTSVHNHTAKVGWGKHFHIKHDGKWGRIWSHSAHCQEIFVKIGDKVTEGQRIATVGKTGTKSGHLHFETKLQPTGVDAVPKTLGDLKKWTNPIDFIVEWSRKTNANMDWLQEYFRVSFQIDLTKSEGEVREQLQGLIDTKNQYEGLKTEKKRLEDEVIQKAADATTWEERYTQAFRRAEEADETIKEKNRELSDKDVKILQLTKELEAIEGKVCVTEEEYKKLTDKSPLFRYSRWQRFISLFRK